MSQESTHPSETHKTYAFTHELKATLKLAGPLVASFIGYQLITLVDTFVAGQLGVQTLAAVSLGGALYWAVTIFPLGLLIGLDPIVSQAVGRGDHARSWRALEEGLGLMFVLACISMPIFYALTQPNLPWSPPGEVTEALGGYTLGRMWSMLPMLTHTCLRCYLQGHEKTKPIFLGTAIANILNLPLSAYLGGGDPFLQSWGIPELGILPQGLGAFGIGLASTFVGLAEITYLLWVITRLQGYPPKPRRGWKELIRIGAPVGGSMLSEGGVFSASTLIVSAWGPVVIGAHQVTLQLASCTFVLCLGISNATTVLVGRAVGQRNWRKSRQAAQAGLLLCLLTMSISALTFIIYGTHLAGLISTDQEVIQLTGELLMIAAAFQLFDGAQVVMAAALRGASYTSIPFWSTLLSHWGVGLSLAYLIAFSFGYGVYGLWWGLSAGLCCAAIILTVSFHRVSQKQLLETTEVMN